MGVPLPMADDDNDPDDTDLYEYGPEDVDPVCVCCGRPAIDFYADRDDMPSCGRVSCELWMQGGLDYMEGRGG